MQTRDRIKELYPGEENKAIRHALYSRPDFCKYPRTDEEIIETAGVPQGGAVAAEPEPAADDADPQPTATATRGEPVPTSMSLQVATLIGRLPTKVTVVTPGDYQEADKWFSAIKGMSKIIEDRRKELKAPVLEEGRLIDEEAKAMQAALTQALAPIEQGMLAFKAQERETLRAQEAERQRVLDEETARLQAQAKVALAALEQAKVAQADPFLSALNDDYDDGPSAVALATLQAQDAIRAVALAPQRLDLPEVAAPVTANGSRVAYPWRVEVINPAAVERIYCSPDEVKLNALARDLKAKLHDITQVIPENYPGLRIYEDIRLGGR